MLALCNKAFRHCGSLLHAHGMHTLRATPDTCNATQARDAQTHPSGTLGNGRQLLASARTHYLQCERTNAPPCCTCTRTLSLMYKEQQSDSALSGSSTECKRSRRNNARPHLNTSKAGLAMPGQCVLSGSPCST